ncbi:unnamed protein product, partial [Urochloa humidicola]
ISSPSLRSVCLPPDAAVEEGAGSDAVISLVAPPHWVLLLRDAPTSQHAVWEGASSEITSSVAAPPVVSILAVPAAVHPDPLECDLHPYMVAADPATGLLPHIARWPMVGFNLDAPRTGRAASWWCAASSPPPLPSIRARAWRLINMARRSSVVMLRWR